MGLVYMASAFMAFRDLYEVRPLWHSKTYMRLAFMAFGDLFKVGSMALDTQHGFVTYDSICQRPYVGYFV